MKRLMYYPGFEVQSTEWLKFALLYIDKLEPIIPPTGDKHLTRLFNKLRDETDLIQIHRPEYHEGEMATLDAIECIEKILRHPQAYSRIFHRSNFIDYWKKPETHRYLLFDEKFADYWRTFCLEHNFGTPAPDGILLPTEIGHLYMTLLAQIIADSKGISTITDYQSLDRFAIFSRSFDIKEQKKLTLARINLAPKLPAPLNQIPIEQFIKFRNQREFQEKLRSFHIELNNYFDNLENGQSGKAFVESFENIWSEFVGDIVRISVETISFGLGVWLAVNNPHITSAEYLKEVAVAGASLTVGSVVDINNTWRNTKTKRYARKYLSSLRTLRPTF